MLSLLLTGCSSLVKESEYRFGDVVKIANGDYANSTMVVRHRINDKYKGPCSVHQYYGSIQRGGLWTFDYVCHEDIGGRY